MKFRDLERAFGAPLQAVIEPRGTTLLVLIPSMSHNEETNIALIEFLRGACARHHCGFASFLPPTPGRPDSVAHTQNAQLVVKALLQDYGSAAKLVVAGAQSEVRAVTGAKDNAASRFHIEADTRVFPKEIYTSLPDRVRYFNKALPEIAASSGISLA